MVARVLLLSCFIPSNWCLGCIRCLGHCCMVNAEVNSFKCDGVASVLSVVCNIVNVFQWAFVVVVRVLLCSCRSVLY